MSESMYKAYMQEREQVEILEHPMGFATYKNLEGATYICDIYVKPDHRKDGVASFLADKITNIAKERGHTALIGSVSPAAVNATASLKVLLAYGFELMSSTPELVYFKKRIA